MILHYFVEILQTQEFDVLISNACWVVLWTLLIIRLDKLENLHKGKNDSI